MKFGIHLPHAGEQATPDLIRRFAIRAEDLGFEDVWVSEHIIVPRDEFPRSPLFYDPVLTLTWVSAVTNRVKLGTSVLVLPLRHPLPLAKELASLHNLSGGRFILGAGVGWLEPEFAALGIPFSQRGKRLDEGLAMMRAVWSQDPVTFKSHSIPAVIEGMTMTPMPISRIPLWLGGTADAALNRAMKIADGWHGSRHTPAEAEPMIRKLRAGRPEPEFTISMRTPWNGKDVGGLRAAVDAFAAIGVQHIVVEPEDRNVDDWDAVIDGAGKVMLRC